MTSRIDFKVLSNFTTTPIDDFRPRPCQNRAFMSQCTATVHIRSPLSAAISLAWRLSFSRASRFICNFGDYPSKKTWCGRRDLNPHGPFKPCGFSYRLRLSPPGRSALESARQVCGLDYPFTILRKIRILGAARLVSTPSRLVSLRAWLGIAISGFPEFEQFCIAGFPDEHSSLA